jgi:hypothetical protein
MKSTLAGKLESTYRADLGKVIGEKIPKGAYVSVGNDGVTRILTQGCRYEVDTDGNVRKFKRICDAKCKGDSIQRSANRFGLIGNAQYSQTSKAVRHLTPEARSKLARLVDKDHLIGYNRAMNEQIFEEANRPNPAEDAKLRKVVEESIRLGEKTLGKP